MFFFALGNNAHQLAHCAPPYLLWTSPTVEHPTPLWPVPRETLEVWWFTFLRWRFHACVLLTRTLPKFVARGPPVSRMRDLPSTFKHINSNYKVWTDFFSLFKPKLGTEEKNPYSLLYTAMYTLLYSKKKTGVCTVLNTIWYTVLYTKLNFHVHCSVHCTVHWILHLIIYCSLFVHCTVHLPLYCTVHCTAPYGVKICPSGWIILSAILLSNTLYWLLYKYCTILCKINFYFSLHLTSYLLYSVLYTLLHTYIQVAHKTVFFFFEKQYPSWLMYTALNSILYFVLYTVLFTLYIRIISPVYTRAYIKVYTISFSIMYIRQGEEYSSKYELAPPAILMPMYSRVSLKAPLVMLKLLPPIFLFHSVQSFRFFFWIFFLPFFIPRVTLGP